MVKITYEFIRSNGEEIRRVYTTKGRADYLRCLSLFRDEPEKYRFVSEELCNE